MACYVDVDRTGKGAGEVYPTCCLDYDKPEDCTYAEDLVAAGLGKRENCKYWHESKPTKCQCCGQEIKDV